MILLIALVAVILLSSRFAGETVDVVSGTFSTAVFCVAGYLIGARRLWLTAYLSLAVPALLIRIFIDVHPSQGLEITDAFLGLGLRLLLILLVFRFSLFERGARQLDRVFAGICGYLILALLWWSAYEIHELFAPGGFAISNGVGMQKNDGSLLYFSLVTLSTLGYGDISPVTPTTRILSALEAVTGTLYLAVFISSLVSGWRGRAD